MIYQPFVSAYDAVRRIIEKTDNKGARLVHSAAARRSALRLTFGLPPVDQAKMEKARHLTVR